MLQLKFMNHPYLELTLRTTNQTFTMIHENVTLEI